MLKVHKLNKNEMSPEILIKSVNNTDAHLYVHKDKERVQITYRAESGGTFAPWYLVMFDHSRRSSLVPLPCSLYIKYVGLQGWDLKSSVIHYLQFSVYLQVTPTVTLFKH